MMKFADLHEQIMSKGFTALSNPLEDLLLSNLRDPYYRVWRVLWRNTVGWNKSKDSLSMNTIAEQAKINASEVSRALHFFHLAGLIHYVPGKWKKKISDITVLPNGLFDDAQMERLKEHLSALDEVENAQRNLRRWRKDKNYRFTNEEFCSKVKAVAALYMPEAKFDEAAWHAALYAGDRFSAEMVAPKESGKSASHRFSA